MQARKIVPLSRSSHVAMHRQLAQRLRESIAGGEYPATARIPTELELTARYGVSRITARQAVAQLVREGVVVRRQGKGTFVAGPVAHHDLLDLRGIYDKLVAQGLNPRTSLIDFREVTPPPEVGDRLRTGKRKLLYSRRFYMVESKPFAVSMVHLAPTDRRITREEMAANQTYAILENILGLRVARADITIRYSPATAELQELLQLPKGAPVMVLERVSYCADGVPREHTLHYAPAETYMFSLTVRGRLPITPSLRKAS
jgi:GntR family transcriptional regulator